MASTTIDSSGIVNSGGPLQFGHAVETWDNGLTGSLDDIRIYNTARSQGAIQSDMLKPLQGNESGLVGYWKFDDGGTIVHDLTGNGNNGTFPQPGINLGACPGALINDPDTAYGFNGGQIALSVPQLNTATNTTNTVSFWMYWDGTDNIIPVGFTTYDLWFNNGNFLASTPARGDIYGISSAGLAGRWAQVVAVFQNGDATQSWLYINGVLQTLAHCWQGTTSTSRTYIGSRTQARISGWKNDGNYLFHGQLDVKWLSSIARSRPPKSAPEYNARSKRQLQTDHPGPVPGRLLPPR